MDDDFWKPYRESTKRYMPAITSMRRVRRFQVGSYRTIVGTDCDSNGLIFYFHVMYVYHANDDLPCLALVSEHYASDTALAQKPFFCLFFGGTHFNLGSGPEWVDLENFTQRALKEMIEPLGLSPLDVPIELPLD